jgi:hypothetical protein
MNDVIKYMIDDTTIIIDLIIFFILGFIVGAAVVNTLYKTRRLKI